MADENEVLTPEPPAQPSASTEFAVAGDEPVNQAAPVAPDPRDEPVTKGVIEDVIKSLATANQKAISSQFEELARQLQTPQTPTPPAWEQPQADPSMVARQSINAQNQMMGDIRKQFANAPESFYAEMERMLANAPSENLIPAHQQGVHLREAAAKKWEMEQAGTWVQGVPQLRTEPTRGSAEPVGALASAQQDIIKIYEAPLIELYRNNPNKVKFTKADYAEAERIDNSGEAY